MAAVPPRVFRTASSVIPHGTSAMETTLDITNPTAAPRRVWVEPWCSEHFLAPGQILRLVVEHPVEPTFGVDERENETVVWLHHHSAVYVVDHDARLNLLDCWCETPGSPTGVRDNQPLLWTAPRRVDGIFYG